MNDDEKQLDALTNQLVTISFGGKSYQARRATLYDAGLMNKKRKELEDSGDIGNINMDVTFFLLWECMKEYNPQFKTYDDLAKSILLQDRDDLMDAVRQLGFPKPQEPEVKKVETGAQRTP